MLSPIDVLNFRSSSFPAALVVVLGFVVLATSASAQTTATPDAPPAPLTPPDAAPDDAKKEDVKKQDTGQKSADDASALIPAGTASTAPTDPSASARAADAVLESAYSVCIESEVKGHDPQACLRDLATSVPNTEVGRRARTVIDAIAVMKRSGARLVPPDAPTAPPETESEFPPNEAPISFDSVVSRVPATLTGVGYGLALGIGGGVILGTNAPALPAGVSVFAGGVVAVGGAVGFGTLGFWLSGPQQFGGEGSWLGSGSLLAGASVGIAAGVAAVDAIQANLTLQQLNQFAPTIIIASGLMGGAAGAAAGVATASFFGLDDDQVAVANGLLGYGAMLGGSLALAAGTTQAAFVGFNGSLTTAGLVYIAGLGLTAGAGFWAVPNLNFNAGEILVSTLAMVATSGVMLATASISSGTLNFGPSTGLFVGGSTAIAGSIGFLGTAAILYLVRDDTRPLFREIQKAGITPVLAPPMVALDRTGKPALMAPSLGITF